MDKDKIIQGDVLEVLKTLEDESIDCVITSPPYWGFLLDLIRNRVYNESICKTNSVDLLKALIGENHNHFGKKNGWRMNISTKNSQPMILLKNLMSGTPLFYFG